MSENNIHCIIDGHHGIYVGQQFAQSFNMREWNVSECDEKVLIEGPACPMTGTPNVSYWDAWEHVLDNAEYQDENGDRWVLEQDGDLFMRNISMEECDDISMLDADEIENLLDLEYGSHRDD